MDKASLYNDLILEELAKIINREVFLEEALITLTYVNCSPDLKQAKVGISVLPDRLAGSALRYLKSNTKHLVKLLKKRLNLRQIPHFIWEFDATEKEAEKIEKIIKGL